MEEQTKKEIKDRLESSIKKFFKGRKKEPNHVLNLIFPKERRIRSLIGGLETSLGLVWETIAVTLAESNGFEILPKQIKQPIPLPREIRTEMATLQHLRADKETWIPITECVARLRDVAQQVDRENLEYGEPPSGHGVDVYLRKNDREYAFDTKTNQPNKGDGHRFDSQLLRWYAYRLCRDPDIDFEARIAFPFSPSAQGWWQTQGTKVYPLVKDEGSVFADSEFWDFCSGQENTWEEIRQIFVELGQEGFGRQFDEFFYPDDSDV